MGEYRTGTAVSADGTVIGYRSLGSGPAVLLVHGGMKAAQHLMDLARVLSDGFTVHVPDRRGRGLSGAHGADFGVRREVEDLQALAAATGATRIFGLSSGALVTLRTALVTPSLDRIALYEPPLSVDGSAPIGWVPRYEREIAAGKLSAALVTSLKGLGTEPVFGRVPRFLLVPFLTVGARLQRAAAEDDVPIPELVPTLGYDMRVIREMADTAPDYAALKAEVLLLDGAKSPAYLHQAVDALSAVLLRSRRVTFPGLGHEGPEDEGDPKSVGAALRDFFADPA
ncbi:alpha/beta fold hydrolase [Amycolatopsis sp. NPDC088138]|uniref:alpha/beta fold hydrolase n=1 Tax=Amycolatopsis sp. NPDC088138 TaxID=3363938 RepID=UPI0037FA8E0F